MTLETFETPQAADVRAILRLFLEKLELLTAEERRVVIEAIHTLNHPMLVSR